MDKIDNNEQLAPFHILNYSQLASTNNEAMRLATEGVPEYTVVICNEQISGRGQRNNTWESEAGKNLTISLILRPVFLPSDHLFLLSKAFSVAVSKVLQQTQLLPATIKWPNDLYVGNKKIAGILLEHSFSGNRLVCSVIGLGLNVNQSHFISHAPNPTSIALERGEVIEVQPLLNAILNEFAHLYECLRLGASKKIEYPYLENLYRKEGYHQYRLPSGEKFDARISDVLNSGELVLERKDASFESYAFKEVNIVLEE